MTISDGAGAARDSPQLIRKINFTLSFTPEIRAHQGLHLSHELKFRACQHVFDQVVLEMCICGKNGMRGSYISTHPRWNRWWVFLYPYENPVQKKKTKPQTQSPTVAENLRSWINRKFTYEIFSFVIFTTVILHVHRYKSVDNARNEQCLNKGRWRKVGNLWNCSRFKQSIHHLIRVKPE